MTESYGPKERYGRTFGDNVLLGNTGDSFFDKPIDEQVASLACSEACPVKKLVIERNGPEAARGRYGEVIFARHMILEEAKEHNPKLYKALILNLKRNPGEPVGFHEADSVPESHLSVIDSNNTPWGFSLPRILLDQFGKREKRTQERIQKGLKILEATIKEATVKEVHTQLKLVAVLAERMVSSGDADTDAVLKSTLSKGYFDEENTKRLYQNLLDELKRHAPTLWKRYTEIDSQTKEKLGIADVPEKEVI